MLTTDQFDIIVGILMLYSSIHFFFIQHNKTWVDRSLYQKIITVMAIVFWVLILMGIMMGE